MRRLTPWILATMVVACAPTKIDLDGDDGEDFVDSDGDGISDDEEGGEGVDSDGDGTPDYLDTDSDNDGWTDYAEVNSYTDPQDPNDHPYEGGWPIDSCRFDLEPTGYAPGDVVENVRLMDQYGEEVSIHDFCDHVVLIEHAGFS
jgi:hypothetical protein